MTGSDIPGDTNQTTGMTRYEAVSGATVGSTKVRMGQTHVAPATSSGEREVRIETVVNLPSLWAPVGRGASR